MCKNSDYLSKKIIWEGNLQKKRRKLLSNIKKVNKSINMLESDIMEVYFTFLQKYIKNNLYREY